MSEGVQVPEEYKTAELGIIPKGWKIVKINDFCDIKTGGTPSTKNKDYWDGTIPWMSSGEINKKFVYNTEKMITQKGLENSNARILPADSVMVALNGQGKTRGSVAVLKIPSTCNQSLACIVPDQKMIHYLYLFYNLQSRYLEIRNYTGDTGREGLNLRIIKDIKVSLPPFPEQQKIAFILSKVDEQIEQTEQIIEKTELLKKGLMQKLLIKGIGHKNSKEVKIGTRHYNIPTTWEVKNIESTFFLKGRIGWQGLTTKEYLNEGTYRLVTGTDFYRGKINWNTCVYVSEERYLQDPNIQLKEKDLLVTKDGTIGKIAYIDKLKKPATLNSGIFVLRSLNNECCPEYLYSILNSFYFELFISILKAGSTISHLYQKDFTKFSFPLPELEEQQKIASILSKVDSQIQDNQNYLTKLQELKRGLMQDLLTGKVRVTV